jgi:hypothetical protein
MSENVIQINLCLRLAEDATVKDMNKLMCNVMDAIERQALNVGLIAEGEDNSLVEFWAGVEGTTEFDTLPIRLDGYSSPDPEEVEGY